MALSSISKMLDVGGNRFGLACGMTKDIDPRYLNLLTRATVLDINGLQVKVWCLEDWFL